MFLLGCGAPMGSVLGYVHANRVSSDAGLSWLPDLPLPFYDKWNLPCARCVTSYRLILFHSMQSCAILFHTKPSILFHAMQYHTMAYHAMPCHAIPSYATSQGCISMESLFFISVFQFIGTTFTHLTQYKYISSYHFYV